MSEGPAEVLDRWHRLHPLSPLVRGGRALVVLLVVAVPRLLGGHGDRGGLIIDAAVVGVGLATGVVSWLVTRWRVEGSDLRIETGLIRRSSQRYPLRQVQAIDVVRSGVARVFGLSELRLRMAGNSARGRLACLPDEHARRLREQLLRLAGAGPAETAGRETRPAPVVRVATGQLVASLLLTAPSLVLLAYVGAIAITAALDRDAAGAVTGGGAATLLTIGGAVLRRFNGDYRLTVVRSAAGFELTSGLVQTTAETLPAGRIQALRMVEPLLWRPFGWCRVEAAVAGRGNREEDGAQGNRRRALLPVGSYAQAHAVIATVIPDVAIEQTRPPVRARWKAPLSYHRLSAGLNATCALTTSGRLRRVSHWVPLEKVQSIRRTQGPVQRRLHLATVHLDTAGPRMRTALRDRDGGEADLHVERLPALCADARGRGASRRG